MRFPVGFARSLLRDWQFHSPRELAQMATEMNWNPEALRIAMLVDADSLDLDADKLQREHADIEELYILMLDAKNGKFNMPGADLCYWLEDARAEDAVVYTKQKLDESQAENIIHWPTGIQSLDRMTGGGYGVTVFAGSPKQGKSLAAVSTAIESAMAGWRVVYVNAEMTPGAMYNRAANYTGHPIPEIVIQRIGILNTRPGCTSDDLLDEVHWSIDSDDDRLLIIWDSLNRLAENDGEKSGGEFGYFRRMGVWMRWAMQARRLSEGRISFLVVSELNSRDRVKGLSLEYSADMLVRWVPESEDDCVAIDVQYSRSSQFGELGNHRRDWRRGRFVPVPEQFGSRPSGNAWGEEDFE